MDYTEAQTLLTKHAGKLQKFLGLGELTIGYKLQRSPDDRYRAECIVNVAYNSVTIWMDPCYLADEQDFLGVLFHELAHVLLRFFNFYSEFATKSLPEGSKELEQHCAVYTLASEQSVAALTKLWNMSLKRAYLTELDIETPKRKRRV